MSDLTPEAIVDYPLKTGVRGYRVDQVDELLDRVADRIERLETRVAELQRDLDQERLRAEEASATESTLKRTLVTAQRAAEETVAEAQQEAERIGDEVRREVDALRAEVQRDADQLRSAAQADAEQARQDAERARREVDLRTTQLRGVAERFRTQMQDHLDAHRALLDQVPVPSVEHEDANPNGRSEPGLPPATQPDRPLFGSDEDSHD